MKKQLNIVLLGYGKMGHMVERIALERGHRILGRITQPSELERLAEPAWQTEADVVIEFTCPEEAERNCQRCLELGLPVVSGTTGWSAGVDRLVAQIQNTGEGTLFWSSNFSVGVHLFNTINRLVARVMRSAPDYRLAMTETHHVHKLDAPSGTAITLAEHILSERPELRGWEKANEGISPADNVLPISSIREGEVAGIHSTDYRSAYDHITLTHEAFGREGFALGAVLAAEYATEHSGVLTMEKLFE